MKQKNQVLKNNINHGFTIVELLVVIVVIGVLAAISIVAYNGIQERAHIASAQSDLRSLGTAMQLHQAEHGSLPTNGTSLIQALEENGVKELGTSSHEKNGKTFMYCLDTSSSMWIIQGEPLLPGIDSYDGEMYYWSGSDSLGTAPLQDFGHEFRVGDSCQSVAGYQVTNNTTWSHDL